MALIKKYKCMNIGGCENANKKTVFEIPVGEELVCPVCKKKMWVEVKSANWVKPAIIAGTVIVLGTGGYFLISQLGGKPELPPTGGGEDTVKIDTVIPQEPVEVSEETFKANPDVQEEPKIEVQASSDPNARVVINLGYGTYTGKVKNGKPHDPNGTIVYKQVHQIESRDVHKRVAQPGDRVTGNFENGHLINGTWQKSDGNQEQLMIGG